MKKIQNFTINFIYAILMYKKAKFYGETSIPME